ncbi:A.superbus venom factor 2-like [Mercenaria mercenaria]|uniref:A.superbus venom factor 2-like n=1 Tax=Mercenaria mercenaria TaxID=6596 RepID=UPI00234F486A|nr:A.superbus venom factor 2-like [Mercenaria mercenaria]
MLSDDVVDVYLKLFMLLYADDTVILAESTSDLQLALDAMSHYCETWCLKVNTNKTKVVAFAKSKRGFNNLPSFVFESNELEFVDYFSYLGTKFSYNGRFDVNKKDIVDQDRKAMFAVISKSRKLNLPVDMQLSLFDTMVAPILMYGSEVVVRGKIVYTKFKWAANQFSERIVEELQEKVSPNARVLVFYIDKSTHELVADSVKFDVNKKCRGEGLKLKTQVEVRPDSSERITVTGSPFMWVGFSVIDKALFLLNDNNVLKKDKMFDFLEAHDLGCGEGGGRTSADVFKKSGLTILTNAAVDDSDLVRYSDRCEGKKRKKRDNGETSHVVKRSLYEESEYISDLKLLAENVVRPRIRSDVRESWFFETTQLDINGQRLEILIFPDSITEWMIQAVGITPDKGLCIADAIDVKAFKSFFIQLDVPYKAVRLKKIDMKATIFSYRNHFLSKDKTANIYFEGAEHVCSNNKPGLPSSRIQVKLAPNSFETVNFPIIPLRFGLFPIRVTAVVTEAGIPEFDIVEKKLFVVNEGVEEQITINVCLDLWNQTDDCKNDERVISDYHSSIGTLLQVDLTLPEASIPHTGAATAYIQSNRMDNVVNTMIEDVASLIKEPSGSGEQIMSRLAPTVYAMRYLKETNQMTRELDIKGNQWIRDGVSAEISEYRQNDGSYAAWRYRKPSTWLTAFVAKVFCKARSVVDDAVDEQEDIKITINWLQNHVEYDGSFVDNMPVLDRGMMGQTGVSDPSLTAFVLVSILECNMLSYKSETVRKATQYLERVSEKLLKNNPYLLAISTYALALATSKEAYRFKGYLHDIQYRDEKDMYWGYAGVRPESAQSVETTSYALLAMIKFGDFKSSAFIVQWLTSQREARGSFSSTQVFFNITISVMLYRECSCS